MSDVGVRAPGPGALRLVVGQAAYSIKGFTRSRASVVLALGLPLTFLVVFGLLVGNETIDEEGGIRVAQYLAPIAAVFAVTMITFSALPTGVARSRESGVLKRLHGTPLPASSYLVGRLLAAVAISLVGVAVLLLVGVVAYDVQLFGRTAAAVVVTLVVGIGCFAALGLAAAAVLRSSSVVEAVTTGAILILAFVSGVFAIGAEMPLWLERLGWLFPLKHFNEAMTTAFDPFGSGAGFSPDHLAVMTVWGVAGLLVAARFFEWDPPRASQGRARHRAVSSAGPRAQRSTPRLVLGQVRYADAVVWRDPGAWFFGLAFPLLLLLLLPSLFGEEARIDDVPIAQHMAAGMPVYAIAVVAYVVQASAAAKARDRGVLKRLGGTPLPGWAYVAGRVGSTLWLSAAATAVMLLVANALYDVEIGAAAIPALALGVVVGAVSLSALGLGLAALVKRASSVDAVALGTLLPLAMVSDVFPVAAEFPDAVRTVVGLLPLKAFQQVIADGLASDARPDVAWASLAVLAAWGVVGAVAATRLLRPEGRHRSATIPAASR